MNFFNIFEQTCFRNTKLGSLWHCALLVWEEEGGCFAFLLSVTFAACLSRILFQKNFISVSWSTGVQLVVYFCSIYPEV